MANEPYASVARLRDHIGKTGAEDDSVFADLLEAASEVIDDFCNRPDGFIADSSATARIYTGSGKAYQRIDECVEITLVAVKDGPSDSSYTSWTTDDWDAYAGSAKRPNYQPLEAGRPYSALMVTADGDYSVFTSGKYSGRRGFHPNRLPHSVPTVQVTAKWGFSVAVPVQIQEAAIIQASRWWKRGKSGWADTAASSEMGKLMFTKVLDPDLALILKKGRFIKWRP